VSSTADERPLPSPNDIYSPAFQHAFDGVPTALVIVDTSGRIASVNPAAERMFLYERNQWQGQSLEAWVPALQALPPDGVVRDLTALRRDETEFPAEICLGPLPTSEGTWVIASIVDLTERKHLETKVREYHELVQACWEAASEGMITVDASGTIEILNKAIERLFGYDRSELLGQPLEIIVPETHRRVHAEKMAGYFAEPNLRAMGMGLVLSGRRKDGTLFPIEVGLNIARVGHRDIAIAFVTDITKKRRLEEQSAALETLVDLHQQLSTSSRKEAPSSDCDPLTNLDTNAMFYQEWEKASSDPKGLYVIVYSVQRIQQMSARYGSAIANRILVFASQYIANSLYGDSDLLFRWDGTTFVALVRRDALPPQVQREVSEACGKRLEYLVEHAGGSALVMIAVRARVLRASQVAVAEIVAEIEQVVAATMWTS
jgi:PAS domain S-box-containing protein